MLFLNTKNAQVSIIYSYAPKQRQPGIILLWETNSSRSFEERRITSGHTKIENITDFFPFQFTLKIYSDEFKAHI